MTGWKEPFRGGLLLPWGQVGPAPSPKELAVSRGAGHKEGNSAEASGQPSRMGLGQPLLSLEQLSLPDDG